MAADLFSDDGANNESNELEPKLFGIEMELLGEELWDLNSGENGSEEEDHCIRASGNHDAGVFCESKRRDELQGSDRRSVDPAKFQVRLLEGCEARYGVLGVVMTDETGLGPEKGVKDELDTVDLGRRLVFMFTRV